MQHRYKVKVKLHQDFVKASGDEIIVGIMSKPQQGKANSEVVSKLAEYFGVSSSKVSIVAGFKSKNKIIDVEK
jgi:uncharacterized protein (TIGR00251 family)